MMKSTKSSSRREDNWKRYPYLFNECKNLVFECECGKKYESFPGLYLHFQRKHGRKISTKFTSNVCSILQEQDRIVYRYTLQEKKNPQEDQSQTQRIIGIRDRLSAVLSEFMGEDDAQTRDTFLGSPSVPEKMRVNKILWEFENFILEQVDKVTDSRPPAQVLLELPLYFNPFMEQEPFKTNADEYTSRCRTLFGLGEWLRAKGHTQLEVLYNEKQDKNC